MQVATASEMRNIDQRTIEVYRVRSIVLMENAGIRLLRFMQTRLSGLERCHVTIVTGRGNNGGDGFVLARHLWHWVSKHAYYFAPGQPGRRGAESL
jgi:NAD(P)H-hydrate epimerase